ncbi:MAG TPA: hybrid sensor histidine kinase/response regulator [Gemmataceae bacterium]|nr:hybrid sensor histidine kinase/response regulator [Gemmataceae bacterium]
MGTGTTSPPAERPIRVLLVDDDRDDYVLTRDLLHDIPGGRFVLDHAPTYERGLQAICRGGHDLYLLDYLLGTRTGLDLLKEAQAKGCRAPVILLTGKGQQEIALEAMRSGAADYLEKAGLTPPLLERTILYALQQHRNEAELERKVRERTEELARANQALKQADRRKDEFLATLAHELRNPLAPIRNALEIMRLAAGDPEAMARQREMLARQVGVMVRLIDDLLDVSRITTGKLRVEPAATTLREVVEAAAEVSRPVLDQAGVSLTVTLPTRSVPMTADRVRLSQVFSNLLNNAAKFTESGGRVMLTAAQDGAHVVIRVRDTGVGITPEGLGRVFDLFTQMDRALNRSQGGLGIGLALVKRVVELHDGTVTARSDGPGKGTEFTIRLPLAGPRETPA